MESNLSTILDTNSEEIAVYEKLLQALDDIHPELYYEFLLDGEDNMMLVLSAHGNSKLFADVESIVKAAPVLTNLHVFALMPAIGFAEEIFWQGMEIALDSLFFTISQQENKRRLTIYSTLFNVPLEAEEQDDLEYTILRAIEEGVGERVFAQSIDETIFLAQQETKNEPLLPLSDLMNSL
ncbi:MAG: hypothetical protein AAF518_19130 [Spirochaetota bacterium]